MEIKPKTITYYELNDIMEEMERRGFMSKRKFWQDYATEFGVDRGAIAWFGFEYYQYTEKGEVYKVYFAEVKRMLGLPEKISGIIVKTDW
ncbi:hypothetical protein Thu_165 [Bacillus phage Thurquoise]|uniref:Uncharacterized protein n=1 Tax=Bacillus phage Deep Blue TaxID=1792245 RepID=A0A140HLT4_9CAUD|nr:hypothetical protein Blue_123 [Bacillus phage Deep Blue]AMO25946.1 hypothetical protein Blue_123 [Bacillus phage Deep Blue]UXQ89008.1 hypothetical protein Thu_165 [Bacillus phage Thurquoise]